MSAGKTGLALIAGALFTLIVCANARAADDETTAPPTQPAATQPSTQPSEKVVKVKRGNLMLEITTEAVFQPADPFEVKLKMKSYAGPLTIASIAPAGPVKAGDTLLELEKTHINWGLEQAENELASARAGLKKAQTDAEIAAKSEALALRMQEDAVKNAESAFKWFESVDGPQMLLTADLQVKQLKDSVGDQEDEMDQLRKMYKSEELTTATADIVIKRALRRLEQSQVYLKMQEERREKSRAQDYPISRQRVIDNVEQARQALASLKAAQELTAVTRKASLANARIAVEQAEQKLGDLKTDAALFSIKSPHDGVVQYGNIAEGSWQGGDPKNLKAGERLAPGAVAMRLYQPGRLKLEIGLSESQAFALEPGMKAKVTPSAFPQLSYEATCGGPVMTPRGNPPAFGFQSTVALPDLDPKLVPGMKAQVKVNTARAENVLLIPLNAISDGKVSVRENGQTTKRDVGLGRSDGKQVEITSGLKDGDEVVIGGKNEK